MLGISFLASLARNMGEDGKRCSLIGGAAATRQRWGDLDKYISPQLLRAPARVKSSRPSNQILEALRRQLLLVNTRERKFWGAVNLNMSGEN